MSLQSWIPLTKLRYRIKGYLLVMWRWNLHLDAFLNDLLQWDSCLSFLVQLSCKIFLETSLHCSTQSTVSFIICWDYLIPWLWGNDIEINNFLEHCHDARLRCGIVFYFWSDIVVMHDVIVYPCGIIVMLLAGVEPFLSWIAWTNISFSTFKQCPIPNIEIDLDLSYWDVCGMT